MTLELNSSTRSANTASHLQTALTMSQLYAIIAGAGPGTGAAIARKFASSYTVVLLARSAASYAPLENEINGSGGKAIGIATDLSSADSIKSAFASIDKQLGKGSICAVRIIS